MVPVDRLLRYALTGPWRGGPMRSSFRGHIPHKVERAPGGGDRTPATRGGSNARSFDRGLRPRPAVGPEAQGGQPVLLAERERDEVAELHQLRLVEEGVQL